MNKLNTSVFLYLLARLWPVDLKDHPPLLMMKKVRKCVFFGVIWVMYSFHNPVFTYGQTTIWLPKVDRTETELTYTYSVQAPDYLANWILNTPGVGSDQLIQKTVDGKNYTIIKRFTTWDSNGSSPEKTGQIRFDSQLGVDDRKPWKFEPKLKDDSQVIQALNSAVIPTEGPWKSAIILALKWEGTTPPSLKFTEKISQLDQAKARMVKIAKNTKAGKFYPEVKVPVDVEGYRAAMLEIVNLARKDPDYRSKNQFASNLRDDIAQTAPRQRQKIYHNSPTSSLFNDVQLDDKLNDLAQLQAEWAAKNNYMGHDGPPNYKGVTMVNFGQRTQYFTPGYISAGEAGGWDTAPEGWMQGETHFRPWFSIGHDVDFVGFGVAIGGDGKLRAFGVATSTRPHTAAAASRSYTFNLPLASGAEMEREKKYISADGRTYLMLPKDGNLGVFLDRSKEPVKENDIMLWGIATSNLKISPWQVASVRISAAGNLEVVDKDGKVLWTSSSQKPKLDQNGLSQEPIVIIGSKPGAQATASAVSTTSSATPGGILSTSTLDKERPNKKRDDEFSRVVHSGKTYILDQKADIYEGSTKIGYGATKIESVGNQLVATVKDGTRLKYDGQPMKWSPAAAAEVSRVVHGGKTYILDQKADIYEGSTKIGYGATKIESVGTQLVATVKDGTRLKYDGQPMKWSPAPTGAVSKTDCGGKTYILDKLGNIFDGYTQIGYGGTKMECAGNQLVATVKDGTRLKYDGQPMKWSPAPNPTAGQPENKPAAANPGGSTNNAGNLALGKPARQSSDIDAIGVAGKAVDGNTDGVLKFDNSNSVSHTLDEQYPYWEVDLGAVYDIDRVVIWNRQDDGVENLNHVTLTISEKPIIWRSSGGVGTPLSNPSAPSIYVDDNWTASQPSKTVSTPGRRGRYVRITTGPTHDGASKTPRPLTLAEVQVFGK